MGTKNKPSPHDAYSKAHPDEPMFVLLGRDPLACHLVRIWCEAQIGTSEEKIAEAYLCAEAMENWAKDSGKSTVTAGAALAMALQRRSR